MQPELHTRRLRLEPLHARHADELHELSSNAEVMRYSSLPVQTRAQADASLEDWLSSDSLGTSCTWVVRTINGDFAGRICLYRIDRDNLHAEIGYMLMPPQWRQGFASEAVAAVVRHAFGNLNLCRLEADVDPGNPGSWRALEKNGFRREGIMPKRWYKDGLFYDAWFYALLNEQLIRKLEAEK